MDSHTHSAQVERSSVIETGRRRRWTADIRLAQKMASCFQAMVQQD
jgi:hypothetical protein